MHGEDVTELFQNKILRNYLCSCARNFTRNPELCEDLLQEGWLAICEEPAGRSTRYYIHRAFLAMNRYYRRDLRQRKLKSKQIIDRMYYRRKKIKNIPQNFD